MVASSSGSVGKYREGQRRIGQTSLCRSLRYAVRLALWDGCRIILCSEGAQTVPPHLARFCVATAQADLAKSGQLFSALCPSGRVFTSLKSFIKLAWRSG